MLNLTFDPFFNVNWGYLTTKALYLLLISIIIDPKVGDKYCTLLNFFHLVICERCTDITGRFKGDTGVITLARFPTSMGNSCVNQRKNKNGGIFVLSVCLYSFDGWTF